MIASSKVARLATVVWLFALIYGSIVPSATFAAFNGFNTYTPPTPATPVVTNGSFSLTLPITNGQAIGTMTATNSPSSWSITSCSPSCLTYFAINNSGAMTVTAAGASGATAQTYTATVQATNGAGSGSGTATIAIGAAYVGMVDQFPSEGATWGFSVYKLSASYAGNFATIQRQSDSTTTTVGFTGGLATASTVSSFCSGTFCYATTIYDQVGSSDATCTNVRVFLAADGRVAISPQAGGKCTVPYSAAYSTAKQELFAVASPMFQDNRPYQSGIPTVTVSGNVTNGSNTITSLASVAGLSAANNLYGQPAIPGAQDSAGCLAGSGANAGYEQLTAVGATTATIAAGSFVPTCSATGDQITFSQAAIGGPWISQGPNSAIGSAYWGFGLSINSTDPYSGDSTIIRNASTSTPIGNNRGAAVGEAMRQTLAVWDVDTFTGIIYYDGVQVSAGIGSSANVTYSTNVGLTLFQAPDGSDQLQDAVFEQMVLVNQTAANRTTVASWLQTQYTLTTPSTAYTDGSGFTYTANLLTPYPPSTNSFGGSNVTDANSITWSPQTGGYYGANGPSQAYATNINNGGTMWRFVDQQGDSDVGITQAERTETASTTARITPGQSASFFEQFVFDAYTSQTGSWCDTSQIHYDNGLGNSAPDIFTLDCKSSLLTVNYQKASSTTVCGSSTALSQGTTYAMQVEIFWSTNHTSDTLDVWIGASGGSLTHVCTASGALFPNDTGAYLKAGIYRGFPYSNPGTLIERVMNALWSNTANTYSAYRTSQPVLPTHP